MWCLRNIRFTPDTCTIEGIGKIFFPVQTDLEWDIKHLSQDQSMISCPRGESLRLFQSWIDDIGRL